jgi:hypothetical protein
VPPLFKMEAPDNAFGGMIDRGDARFDAETDVAPALCDAATLRAFEFLSIFVRVSRLYADETCRTDRRVAGDGPAETPAARNTKFDQRLGAVGAAGRTVRPQRAGSVSPGRLPHGRTDFFYAASERRIA